MTAITERCHDGVTVERARRLIEVYADDPGHPWFLEWAECIVTLADENERLRAENGRTEPGS